MLNYKRQIIVPMLVASLLLVVGLLTFFYANYHLNQLNVLDSKLDSLRFKLLTLENAIVKTESGQRGFLLTSNLIFVDTFNHGQADVLKISQEINQMLPEFNVIAPAYNKVERLIKQSLFSMNATIQTGLNYGVYAPHLNTQKINAISSELIAAELKNADALLVQNKGDIHQKISRALNATMLIGAMLLSIIVGILIFGYRRVVGLFELAETSKNEAEKFSHVAYHDALTMLPNRRYFDQHIVTTLEHAKKYNEQFAVFYLDLDGFKNVNDDYGHDVGDEVLKNVAKSLKSILRDSDFLARLGGDEFAIIVHANASQEELERLTKRIIEKVSEPIPVSFLTCELGVSIGVACYPNNETDVEKLMYIADNAMYQAKRTGKNKAVFA